MKKSKDWVRNPAFDKLLDAYVEQNGEFPADMLPNEIAGLLGLTANGEFYKKHRAWKRRREAAANLPAMDIPCEAKAELTNILAATTEDVLNHFVRTVRTVAGDIIRTADLGVADANRRAAEAEAELAEVLDAWTVTEGERDAA
uniref:hypothetical protein n=1 Tax=Blastomonas sp. TaxID=1909299 RepID=UPI0035936225